MSIMTETTTGATKGKAAQHITDSLGMSKYGMPTMEVPAEFRDMTDKVISNTTDTYSRAKVASEEAADLLGSTYAAVAKCCTGYNLKLLEIARTNTRAAFDYAHELLGVKSPSEYIELSAAHMRKQFDIASAQNKELCALAQGRRQ
jgi:phasin